jgi:hypothetical protein
VLSSEERKHLHFFWAISLSQPAALLETIATPDDIAVLYGTFSQENARTYFIVKVLTEVQNLGFALRRWDADLDFIGKDGASPTSSAVQQTLAGLTDEQSLWGRKLTEILVALINFGAAGSDVYYHYLSLKSLWQYIHLSEEQAHYFGQKSAITERSIESLRTRVSEAASRLGSSQSCWYLDSKSEYRIVSFSQSLKVALPKASTFEKRSLAYTYGMGFGTYSEDIHFSPLRRGQPDLVDAFRLGVSLCGLLSTAILLRIHTLLDVEPPEGMATAAAKDPNSESPVALPYEVGDFVMAGGPYLGRVEEIWTHPELGYRTFLVKYLAEPPITGVERDWIPSTELGLFLSKTQLSQDVMTMLRNELGSDAERLSPEDLDRSIEKSAVKSWHMGLNQVMRRTFTTYVPRALPLHHDLP